MYFDSSLAVCGASQRNTYQIFLGNSNNHKNQIKSFHEGINSNVEWIQCSL